MINHWLLPKFKWQSFYFIFFFPLCFFGQRAQDSLRNIIKTSANDSVKIIAYTKLANLELSNPKTVLSLLSEMNVYCEKIKNERNKALCLRKIGAIYSFLAYYDRALEYTYKAANLFETAHDKYGLAYCYNNIGNFYNYKGEITKDKRFQERSIEYHLKSIALRDTLKDTLPLMNSYNNIANSYMEVEQFETSLKYFRKGMAMMQVEDAEFKEMINSNIGKCYFKIALKEKKDEYYKKALFHYFNALEALPGSDTMHNRASILISIGAAYYELRNISLGISYLTRGLELAKNNHNKTSIIDASLKLSEIYEKQGDCIKALGLMRVYNSNKDSLINEKNSNSMEEMQAVFQVSQKDVEIEKLNGDKKLKEVELKRNKLILVFSISAILIVIVFALFIFRSLQQNRKANRVITAQKNVVEAKNHIIEEKQKEIIDSINYAKRIQDTILAHPDYLAANLPEYFIYFNPKDIVSGDFYWATKKENKFYLAVCDSTGHGVPGAFMSLLNIGFLSEAINEKNIEQPHEVFNYVRQRLVDNISKEGQKDGFDGVLICFDLTTKQITYSAANNKPLLISDQAVIELEGDRMPVGIGEKQESFNLYVRDLKKGDCLYLYTDGYADQFGGPKGKKFKYKPLNDLLLNNHNKSMLDQQNDLKVVFENWQGDLEQIDDVCVIGIRI